jgi:hypothetical protein
MNKFLGAFSLALSGAAGPVHLSCETIGSQIVAQMRLIVHMAIFSETL